LVLPQFSMNLSLPINLILHVIILDLLDVNDFECYNPFLLVRPSQVDMSKLPFTQWFPNFKVTKTPLFPVVVQ
jgi:hypothetical protein